MARRKRWSFFSGPLENRGVLWFDDFHRGEFTVGGRALFWGMILSGGMLMGGLTQPLVLSFGFSTSALLIAGFIGVYFRPRLRLTRRITTYPSAGEVFSYRVDVENVGKRTARNVVIEERRLPPDLRPEGESPMIDSLEPGEKTTVTLKLRCVSRDWHELKRLQGATTFPTGLVKSGKRSHHIDRLVVYPRITDVGHFVVPHSSHHQPGGIAVASQVGESTEFLGTRDWRQGDRLRDIHWPSSARTGRLIAREFQEEYFVRLAIVLDVQARWARDERRLEKAISLAAGIADVLARQEYIIDIFAAGDDVYHFQAGRALAHLDNILELLACLEPGGEMNFQRLESVLLPETQALSAIILIMMDWDGPRRELVRRLKSHGVAVRVICMKPGRALDGLDHTEIIEAS
ncbi:DUF58 domain-containing protein [Neorhodopirellula pilleata]|uniref:DUF58 domain-containing protein n=1 Tax=Neorhodopirellula pilleata TaxID=2714738 RepID=A0A5C6A2U3_9BACT|nr:DUF58 domain-containing protein [Neorhodopirellula pilleata]TWT93680.1 hypothetical protein Pla100_41980 [Neorhodopirellula pilleata]